MSVMLDQPAIQRALRTTWVGKTLYYYPVVLSTNDRLKELANRGAPSGTVLLSDYQIRGKGRHGRRWSAPPKTSILMSLLLRPNWLLEQSNWLSMIAGVATVRAIKETVNLEARLKWPNDILLPINGQERKIGGILVESSVEDNRLAWAVVGIGLNVNIGQEHFPVDVGSAGSIMMALNRPIGRLLLLVSLLKEFESEYETAASGISPRPVWNSFLQTIGQQVSVLNYQTNQRLYGTAVGTDSWGRLIVRDEEGQIQLIAGGDVTLQD